MKPNVPARITLTTDFGTRDPYVAAMKGVISGICPEAVVLDLSHEIAPQALIEGALFVAGAAPYFPAGSVHVVVVDPGVGSDRRAVAVQAGDQYFVCPDNGLLTLFLRNHPLQQAVALAEQRFMRQPISATFHGRDVFAPVAAHLAKGVSPSELGPSADNLVTLDIPEAQSTAGALRGEVIHVDRFGNLITNVSHAMIAPFQGSSLDIRLSGCRLGSVKRTYSDVAVGSTLALIGSSGYLEVAVNGGSAAVELGSGAGTPVEIGLP